MDDMRNRHHGFPRMANWMSGDDDGGMADLASRMSHTPNWPLSMGRRGGPWRERRNSGGSAMSATSEDDSSYDTPANDKSSQGSGGSGGMDAVSHDIPIMIEAEAPPGMMPHQPPPPQQQQRHPQQDQQQQRHPQQDQQQQPPVKPFSNNGPLLGQVRKSPQYATRTTSANEGGSPPEHPRATRCASAPPQMIDQNDGPNSRFATKLSVSPQSRSATVPISPHNNVAKPFVSSYKSNSPRTQDPIAEENFQQQPTQEQPSHESSVQEEQQPQQQQYSNQPQQESHQQPHQQQQWHNQPQYQQEPHYQEYDHPYQQYYQNDPRSTNQDHFYQQPQQQHHQRPSVIRNIPIFIEGHDNPIRSEEKIASLSSSPRPQPSRQQHQPQHHQQQPQQQQQHPQQQQQQHPQQSHNEQDPFWNHQQQFFRNTPPFSSYTQQEAPFFSSQQHYFDRPQSNYHQQQQHPQHQQEQQYYQQPQQQQQQKPQQHTQQQQHPQQQQQQHPQQQQQHPQQQQQHPSQGVHEIPIQPQQQQARPPSPQPHPPPVKLTPLQKIEKVRNDNEELMKKVDDFEGPKKGREFIYLDEMLTRALISLDDIDPDGHDEIRQARRALIKDINSKISLLEKKASAVPAKEPSPATSDSTATNGVKPESGGDSKPSEQINSSKDNQTSASSAPPQEEPSPQNQDTKEIQEADVKSSETKNGTAQKAGDSETPAEKSNSSDSNKEAIPCPAPAIPLPEK
uniref:Mediator of RNA polymerase II transcription subunit 12 n=1 Tax=Hirondellea gigas TaxID=1518452 RepID=A0A6A7FXA0_9CRUS